MAAYPSSPGARDGHPFPRTLLALSTACFLGALTTDIVYVHTVEPWWYTFSVWLLTAGLTIAAVAAVGAIIRLLSGRWRLGAAGVIAGLVVAVALVLEIVNAFVHSRDGYTTVVPTGLTLSVATAILLLVAALLDRRAGERRVAGGRI